MIKRADKISKEKFENKFGGEGYILVRNFIENDEELNNKGRVFAHTTLNPGCEIGYHVHDRDMEIYYIYSGEAQYNDNGVICTVGPGDVTFTPVGTGHGIKNLGNDPVEIIALIVYPK